MEHRIRHGRNDDGEECPDHRPERQHKSNDEDADIERDSSRRGWENAFRENRGVNEGLRNEKHRFLEKQAGNGRHAHLEEAVEQSDRDADGENPPTTQHGLGFPIGRGIRGIGFFVLILLGESHGALGGDWRQGEGQFLDIGGQPEKKITERVFFDEAQQRDEHDERNGNKEI